jgi:hypothetical protein
VKEKKGEEKGQKNVFAKLEWSRHCVLNADSARAQFLHLVCRQENKPREV